MADSWKRTVGRFSDTVFPGLTAGYNYGDGEVLNIENGAISSLPLQMSLYFNVFFFPVWLVTTFIMLDLKFNCLSNLFRFIVVTVLVAVVTIECLRLYLGYLGNISEKVPELVGFWMLSLLLQFPLQLFLLINEAMIPLILERIVQTIMIMLLVIQLCTGFITLRQAAKHQVQKFQLLQFQDSQHTDKHIYNCPKHD